MEKENQVNILWEKSTCTLPSVEELTPITQSLISPELATAFRIRPEVAEAQQNFELHVSSLPTANYFLADHEATDKTSTTVVGRNKESEENYQSSHALIPPFCPVESQSQQQEFGLFSSKTSINLQKTLEVSRSRSIAGELLLGIGSIADGMPPYDHDLQRKKAAHAKTSDHEGGEKEDEEEDELEEDMSWRRGGEKPVQLGVEAGRGMYPQESKELGAGGAAESSCGEEVMQGAARSLKRPRLVWTPQLHKRFVDAVAHLGMKNAVPKTIMQLMNVEGLTRENVASHLQKYRLYLKRVHGIIMCNVDGSSSSDIDHPPRLFASTILPPPPHFDFTHPTNPEMTAIDLPVAGLKRSSSSLPQVGALNQAAFMQARPRAMAHHSTSSAVMHEDEHQENGSASSSQGILTLFPMTSR